MKNIILILAVASFCLTFGQTAGEIREFDGQTFQFHQKLTIAHHGATAHIALTEPASAATGLDSFWVHQTLGENYEISKSYATYSGSNVWQKWYSEGSPTLQRVLDLGSVHFMFKGADRADHVYSVFPSEAALAAAFPSESKVAGGLILGVSPTAAAIAGGALVAAAIIVENNNNQTEVSQTKK